MKKIIFIFCTIILLNVFSLTIARTIKYSTQVKLSNKGKERTALSFLGDRYILINVKLAPQEQKTNRKLRAYKDLDNNLEGVLLTYDYIDEETGEKVKREEKINMRNISPSMKKLFKEVKGLVDAYHKIYARKFRSPSSFYKVIETQIILR